MATTHSRNIFEAAHHGVCMKEPIMMLLFMVLGGCNTTHPDDDFSSDKQKCEEVARGSSPYANTTRGVAEDPWTTCMSNHGWSSLKVMH
jgi:hypothetical protein